MKCPIDHADLMMTDRQGIEIDYCPKCRGVWLDRGELDKLIERASASEPAYRQAQPPRGGDETRRRDDDKRDFGRDGYRDTGYDPRRKKRKSIFDEIFDF